MDGIQNLNSFRTFENTRYQAFNERLPFELAFKNYLISQQKSYPKVIIEGKELDAFILFHLVVQQGGLDEVNRKGWQTVLTKMGIDPNPTNQASVVGYYTACMQTLEISVKATLNPQFGGFQAQGQNQAQQGQAQVQVQHQNTQAQQGFYGNQGYPSQQYQNANQFAQNQRQDFSKSPAVFSNQLQNPAIGNQYQNPGLGQYPGMGFQAQNQPFATQLQGYPNQAYTGNQGFAQQSYGQAQSVSNQQQQAHNFGQGQISQTNQQSPRQIPNQLPGQYSLPAQQQGFSNQPQQGQAKYPPNQQKQQGMPQSQQFANQIQQTQQYPSNQMSMNPQTLGYSPQSFQGLTQPQMRQATRPQQQQFQGYASQLPAQPYSNLMFNNLGTPQQPFLSQLSVAGQSMSPLGMTGMSPTGLGSMPQMSPTGSVQSAIPQVSNSLNQQGTPSTGMQSTTMSGISNSPMQAQTNLQYLNSMFSNIEQGPEKLQSPAPALNSASIGNGFQSPVDISSPAINANGAGITSTPANGSPVIPDNVIALNQAPPAKTTKPNDSTFAQPFTSPKQSVVEASSPQHIPKNSIDQEVKIEPSEQIAEQDEKSEDSVAKKSDKDEKVVKEDVEEKGGADNSNRRSVNTVGGLDIQLVVPYLTRPRTIKEVYSLRSLPYLDVALKSRLPMQVKYSLDAMLTLSSELALKFSEFPSLLTSIVNFMREVLEIGAGKMKDEFISYSLLFDIELTVNSSLQANCETSIDEKKVRNDYINVTGLILRNCCLTPENHALIGSHIGWKNLILECIQLPIPLELRELIKGKELISYSSFNILEQRKNALISLASLGHCVVIPDSEKAFMILEMCIDFMSIANSPYVYPALDALARILVNPANLGFFTSCKNQKRLVETLLDMVPSLGFSLSASTQQLSEWELAMMVLGTIVTNCEYQILQQIGKIPQFCRIMFNLVKKPFRAGMGQDAYTHLHGMRERGLRCLLAVLKVKGLSRSWEQELLEYSISSHLSGDAWIGPIILQEISLAE